MKASDIDIMEAYRKKKEQEFKEKRAIMHRQRASTPDNKSEYSMAVVPYSQGNQLMDMAKRIDVYKTLMKKCDATMKEQEQRAIQQERAIANI